MNRVVSKFQWQPLASVVLLAGALWALPGTFGHEPNSRETNKLDARADAIRASAGKLAKVQRIPWVTDVEEGFRLAKEEKRPVFLYVITGDPLGDC